MKINCDIGERGHNEADIKLMQLVDIANIACGGHAGDAETVSVFREVAQKNNVKITAHLSYPDKENFGRFSMNISPAELKTSLSEQYTFLPGVKSVKLHGALYNDCWFNEPLSEAVAEWLMENNILEVLAPGGSVFDAICRSSGINVITEAFAERRYNFDSSSNKLSLVARSHPMASISDCEKAVSQFQDIKAGKVRAFIDNTPNQISCPISAETICIHSDSAIALELAGRLRNV